MGKKNNDIISMGDLLAQKKELDKKLGQVMIPCPHTNSNGKLKVDFLNSDKVRCKKCRAEFSVNPLGERDLRGAIETVHDAINQIKIMSEDPEREAKIIKDLGNLDYNLMQISELYSKTLMNNTRSGKKKKKNNNEFGGYGTSSIKFM